METVGVSFFALHGQSALESSEYVREKRRKAAVGKRTDGTTC